MCGIINCLSCPPLHPFKGTQIRRRVATRTHVSVGESGSVPLPPPPHSRAPWASRALGRHPHRLAHGLPRCCSPPAARSRLCFGRPAPCRAPRGQPAKTAERVGLPVAVPAMSTAGGSQSRTAAARSPSAVFSEGPFTTPRSTAQGKPGWCCGAPMPQARRGEPRRESRASRKGPPPLTAKDGS